jgi:hypothetical protein
MQGNVYEYFGEDAMAAFHREFTQMFHQVSTKFIEMEENFPDWHASNHGIIGDCIGQGQLIYILLLRDVTVPDNWHHTMARLTTMMRGDTSSIGKMFLNPI